MPLPEQIIIGPMAYKVTQETRIIDHNGRDLSGETDAAAGVMKISNATHPVYQAVTLWHEIIHTILVHAGVDPDLHDEGMIDQLAYGTVDILRRNPDLVAYLTATDEEQT